MIWVMHGGNSQKGHMKWRLTELNKSKDTDSQRVVGWAISTTFPRCDVPGDVKAQSHSICNSEEIDEHKFHSERT